MTELTEKKEQYQEMPGHCRCCGQRWVGIRCKECGAPVPVGRTMPATEAGTVQRYYYCHCGWRIKLAE